MRRALLAVLPRFWGLKYLIWENDRAWSRAVAAAKARKERYDDVEQLESEYHMEDEILSDDLEVIRTWRLMRRTRKYDVPTPPYPWETEPPKADDNRYWDESRYTRKLHLKPEGYYKLRSDLRAEQRARLELWKARIDIFLLWFIALTGVLGAATGLAAVLLR